MMAPKQHYGMPEEYKALTKTSKERLGFDSFIPWNQVREVLTCHVVHGVPLPPPVDEGYVDRVVAFTSRMWGQWFRHPEFARLGIGPFIDELLQAVDARVADASPHHMLLYAGTPIEQRHASLGGWGGLLTGDGPSTFLRTQATTAPLSRSSRPLGFTTTCTYAPIRRVRAHLPSPVHVLTKRLTSNPKPNPAPPKNSWPPYSSHILLELAHHKENPQEHYVRVLYNDEEKIGACVAIA